MAQVFEERGFGAAAEFEQAAKNASLIADLDPEATDLEGYLFPETYALPRGTSATELVTQMVGLFKRLYAEPLRAASGGGRVQHEADRDALPRSSRRRPRGPRNVRWSRRSTETG